MRLSPIVLFIYHRPEHTAKTIRSLIRNDFAAQSDLFVYCDGPRDAADAEPVARARQAVQVACGHFRSVTIRESATNNGLARSVIHGVSEVIAERGRVIVLEDDLVLARGFLSYMNAVLDRYADDKRVFSVSGHVFPHMPVPDHEGDVVALPRCSTWGWGTWLDRWERADWEQAGLAERLDDPVYRAMLDHGGRDLRAMLGEYVKRRLDSWGIPWCLTHLWHHAQIVFPVKNRVLNIGMDGSGRHCAEGCPTNRRLYPEPARPLNLPLPLPDDTALARSIMRFWGNE